MRVLLTNDDAYFAPGMRALVDACDTLGFEGVVVAPLKPMSATSRSVQFNVQVDWEYSDDIGSFKVVRVNSTPATCVIMAITSGLFGRPFDLCISGVNAGENIGLGLQISGTFGAAQEASGFGVRAVAISRQYGGERTSSPDEWDWSWVSKATEHAITHVLDRAGPWTLANVNLPNSSDPSTLITETQLSKVPYFDNRYIANERRIDNSIRYDRSRLHENDDISAFAERSEISVTYW